MNGLLKLSAIAGVIGIGGLMVLQVADQFQTAAREGTLDRRTTLPRHSSATANSPDGANSVSGEKPLLTDLDTIVHAARRADSGPKPGLLQPVSGRRDDTASELSRFEDTDIVGLDFREPFQDEPTENIEIAQARMVPTSGQAASENRTSDGHRSALERRRASRLRDRSTLKSPNLVETSETVAQTPTAQEPKEPQPKPVPAPMPNPTVPADPLGVPFGNSSEPEFRGLFDEPAPEPAETSAPRPAEFPAVTGNDPTPKPLPSEGEEPSPFMRRGPVGAEPDPESKVIPASADDSDLPPWLRDEPETQPAPTPTETPATGTSQPSPAPSPSEAQTPPAWPNNPVPSPAAADDSDLPPWLRDEPATEEQPSPAPVPNGAPQPTSPPAGEPSPFPGGAGGNASPVPEMPATTPDPQTQPAPSGGAFGFPEGPAPATDDSDLPPWLRDDPEPSPAPVPSTTPETRPVPTPPVPERTPRVTGDGLPNRDVPRNSRQPELKIEKLAPPNAVIGKPLVYQILVKNVGDSAADKVVVEDRIPKGTEMTGSIPQATLVGTTLTWRLGRLESGAEKRIAVRVVPKTTGRIGSVATVNFVAEVTSETKVIGPKLFVDVQSPRASRMGEAVEVSFTIENRGGAEAANVVLQSLLSDGLEHPAGNDLEYVVNQLPAGEKKQVTLELQTTKSGRQTITTTLQADGVPALKNESAIEVNGSRVTLTRVSPKARYAGRPVIVENRITNESTAPIEGVAIVEWLPQGMRFVEASHGGTFDAQRGLVVWKVPPFAAGEEYAVKLKVLPETPGTVESVVKSYDPNGSFVVAKSSIRVVGRAALGLVMDDMSQPLAVGERMTLSVAAVNRGTAAADDVALSITLPDAVDAVAVNGPVKHVRQGRVITFEPIGSLDQQKQTDFSITLEGRKPGDSRVKFSIAGAGMTQPIVREEAVYVFADE